MADPKTAPTAGPWLALPIVRGRVGIYANWHGERSLIAATEAVYDRSPGRPLEAESAANALLMATAPDLLAELRNVLRCYDRDNVPSRQVEANRTEDTERVVGQPGVLVKINHATAARMCELVSRFGV